MRGGGDERLRFAAKSESYSPEHSRVAFARIRIDETTVSCLEFLREAIALYASIGVRIESVMTDNGTG